MRKLSWLIAGVLCTSVPAISHSAELGVATVKSNLTEPLSVRIPLNISGQQPVDEIQVGLASPEAYSEAGLTLDGLVGNLNFDVVEDGSRTYVDVTSRRPISEPILSLLLQARSGQGTMMRRYTLLLDPPAEVRTPTPRPAAEQPEPEATPEPTAPEPAPRSRWERVADVPELDMTGNYHVQSGDTLYAIARQYVEAERDVRPMMQAIIDANPQAFVDGDGNTLFADVTLDVPEPIDAAEPTQAEVDTPPEPDEAVADVDASAETTEEQDAVEVELDTEPMLSLLDVEQAATDAELDSSEADPIREEELLALQSQNEDLQSQLSEVGDELSALQEAISLRDDELADLQAQVEASQERAAQASAEALAMEDELRAQQQQFFVTWGPYLTGALGLIIIALALALFMRRDARAKESAAEQQLADVSAQPTSKDDQSGQALAAAAGAGAAGLAASTAANADADSAEPPTAQAKTDDHPEPEFDAVVDDEDDAFADSADDPSAESSLTPEAAAEEARVLASFNLNSQAEEMLQEALSQHPDHPVLLAALDEIRSDDDADEAAQSQDFDQSEDSAREESDLRDQPDDEQAVWAEADDASAFEEPESSTPSAEDDSLDMDDFAAEPTEKAAEETEPSFEPQAQSEDAGDDLDFDLSDYDTEPEQAQSEQKFEDDDAGMDLTLPEEDETADAADSQSQDADALEDDALELPDFAEESDAAASAPDLADEDDGLALPEESDDLAEADEQSDDDQVDTRVGLAEAFLEMGDQDGFEMIEAELRDENNSAALAKLEEVKKRYS